MLKVKKVGLLLCMCLTLMCFSNVGLVKAAETHVIIQNGMEVEPNNSPEQANLMELTNGQALFNGVVTDSSDLDYFEYTPDMNMDIEFTFITNSDSTYFYAIWDMTKGTIVCQKTVTSPVTEKFLLKCRHRCLIAITTSKGSNSQYQISFMGTKSEKPVTLEGQNEMESNDEITYANILPRSIGLYCANIANSNDLDYFTIKADESANKKFVFYPGTSDNFFIMLYDITSQKYITEGYIKQAGHYEETPFYFEKGHEYRIGVAASVNAMNANYYFQFINNQ